MGTVEVTPPAGLLELARQAVKKHGDVCECVSADVCDQALAETVVRDLLYAPGVQLQYGAAHWDGATECVHWVGHRLAAEGLIGTKKDWRVTWRLVLREPQRSGADAG